MTKQKTYSKSIVINEKTNEHYKQCLYLLSNFMFEIINSNEELLCFFRADLDHSDKTVDGMELTFKWSTLPNNIENL